MSPLSRRGFIGAAAASGAGVALAGSGLSPVVAEAVAATDGMPGTLDDIEHVVILMQENRSFDHYFGTLAGVRGYNDRSLVRFANGGDVLHQRLLGLNGGTTLLPWHLDTTKTNAQRVNGLDHSWDGGHSAWANGQYSNWIPAKTWMTMGYYTRADIPFQYALADNFTVCDQYFCSSMTSTNPNRLFLWSGTIDPRGEAGGPVTDNSEKGYTWTTYPERLEAAGVSWRVYQQQDNYDDNALAWFKQFQNAPQDSSLWVNGMTRRGATAFADDVAAGRLPAVSWVVAPEAQSEHPNYAPAQGADFTASYVLDALAKNPAVWAKTVVFLNYDENDGFFDHVVPPTPPAGTPDEFVNGQPIGLGARVPMIVISPWSRGARTCSEVFDHTSVLRFLERWTGVRETNISQWRRTVCGDLLSAFAFTGTNVAFPTLPDTKKLLDDLAGQRWKLPPLTPPIIQHQPGQESGDREGLPLAYGFATSSWTQSDNGTFWIKVANTGQLGAGFSMYTVNHRNFGAWQYTVPAGGSVQDYFSALGVSGGPYDIDAHGPDGYLRGFKGDVRTWRDAGKAHPEAAVVDRPGRRLTLTLTNSGGKAAVFTIAANAAEGASGGAAATVSVAPGETHRTDLAATAAGRYDITVTADSGDGFTRRFAGRLYS
ncbi:phospholipase C, phosphocholine-specific [Yinghuangia aomiensis]|uniref:phospholipase C n=1 Tax=Yinghuangia aomiensis TaxID=676205 RepID=A0ABP9I9B4_9ACTN